MKIHERKGHSNLNNLDSVKRTVLKVTVNHKNESKLIKTVKLHAFKMMHKLELRNYRDFSSLS